MSSQVGWLYVDLNSYFASVEQHLNPKLRGRPVAVVPMIADSTCVIAASYEAKKFGVKTGTLVGEARRMCPGLVLVSSGHGHYVEFHKKIVEAIESCHPVTSVASIDEVACALRGRDRQVENATRLAKEIKTKIYSTVGEVFGCSIGLAPNRFLAKLASDMQKPNGLVVLLREDIPHKLYPLKLRDLVGIGERMEARLHDYGVRTIEKLYGLTQPEMRKVWGGIGGERFYLWLRGVDLEVDHRSNQSIGHQHVLPPRLRTRESAYAVGQKLLHKAAVRLRKIQAWARSMSVFVKFLDHTHSGAEIRMSECQDTFTLQEVFDRLWASVRQGGPIQVSVTLGDFVFENERTFSFFEDPKRIQLSRLMDEINVRHGKNTIHLGSVHEVLNEAPARVAFTSIPEPDT